MPASALRPRSVTEIVDAAFQVFRAQAGPLVMCSAVAYVPTLLVRLLVIGDPNRFIRGTTVDAGALLRVSGWSSVATLLTYAIMTALLTVCASQAYLGEEVDVGAAVRRVIARLPALIGAAVIVAVLTFLGAIFLFVPAMYVTARYFAVTPAIVLEDRGLFDALSRSSELSEGRKWHVLNALGLVLLIYFVLYFGFAMVGTFIGGFVVQSLMVGVVTILLYPAIVITAVLLYYDARIQREGFDIELMADALDAAPRPATP